MKKNFLITIGVLCLFGAALSFYTSCSTNADNTQTVYSDTTVTLEPDSTAVATDSVAVAVADSATDSTK